MTGWRRWLRVAFIAIALLLIVGSFLPLWQTDEWWVRYWDYPRLQVAGLLLLAGTLLLSLNWRWSRGEVALGIGLLAALVWQVTHFVEYLPFWPKQVAGTENCAPGQRLTLLNSNVLMDNRQFDRQLAMIREQDADVLLLLETGPEWADHLRALYPNYPYHLAEPAPTTYGMMLLSRLPMKGVVRHRLQAGVPSIDALVQLRGGEVVEVKALHPEPPWPGDDSGERDAELVQAGKEIRASGRAGVVLGDLNDVAWSRSSRLFRKVGGMGDPRVGRGLYPTFTAQYPLLRWPLDHLFVTPHWRLLDVTRLGPTGSDHFPIRYSVCLAKPAGERLVPVALPEDVRQEARDQQRDGVEEKVEEDRGEE